MWLTLRLCVFNCNLIALCVYTIARPQEETAQTHAATHGAAADSQLNRSVLSTSAITFKHIQRCDLQPRSVSNCAIPLLHPQRNATPLCCCGVAIRRNATGYLPTSFI
jgi:hypothetical protein